MAKNIAKEAANGSDHATKHHNVKARKEAFDDALKRTLNLDRQIAELMEEHIKPLRAEKADIKSSLNDGYNVTAKAFNARYQAYKFEANAIAAEDNASLDTLRELFESTPVGGQVDFIDALNKGGDAAASAATH